MAGSIVFYSVSVFIILFALLTLKFSNIFYSLLSSMCVFFLAAVIFYTLGSEYNAVIQFAVYGLAVPVILGVAVMFTGYDSVTKKDGYKGNKNSVLILLGLLFILAFVYLVLTSYAMVPESFSIVSDTILNNYENMMIFSKGIFVRYVFAFELISLILTIIVVGLTMFKRNKNV